MLSSLLSDAAQDNSVQDTGPDIPVTAGALTAPVIQRSGRGANVHDVPVASVRTCVPPPPRGAGLRPIFDPAPVTACGMDTAKPIALALQGGGAHAAFCWGVLDRLLEDE